MRPAKACLQCRLGKRRCDPSEGGGTACDQCLQRNLHCSAALGDSSRENNQQQLARSADDCFYEEARYLVDLYFVYIHDKAHPLFHEPTFKESVRNRTVSRPLLLSIMGLSARYAENKEIRSRGTLYAAEATKALKDNLESISIENIQTCIIVGNCCIAECDANAQSLYFALAYRMAQILWRGPPDVGDDGITMETKRRVWWTCFVIDAWGSAGSGLSRQFQTTKQRIRVPLDETTFYLMKPGDPDVSSDEWKPGLWAHAVELVHIYGQIQDLHRDLAEAVTWDEDLIEDRVRRLDAQLATFQANLDSQMRYSRESLAAYVQRGLGRSFIAFHLGLHHYGTLLYYEYLDHRRPSTRDGKVFADRCKYYATMVCEILRASREQEGAEALYSIVGHVTTISSSVLLHTYLFGAAHELPEAKWRLESNFESLKQLRSLYPNVELIVKRLTIFQNHCLRSSSGTYKFDRWMVKFLIQHASSLEEKHDIVDAAVVDNELQTSLGIDELQLERSRVTSNIIRDI